MTTAPALQVSGQHEFTGRRLFAPIDLTLPAGQWTCVLGRSGVGKSTLLRLIAGLETVGRFNGDITASDGETMTGRVSLMAQSDLLLPWLTVLENIVLGARLRGQAPDMTRANDLLHRVGLAAYREKKPATLSGGMRQRTALARTLMEDRDIVLLDEPFSALDAGTRADMQDLAAQILHGKTVLLVTHDPTEAVRLGHQIVVLTPQGLQPWETPDTPPIRGQFAPETTSCQADLLAHLRGAS
ncbi:MAG: ABC transporter ATP-binding protein [Paracoccaceae bacterium]